MKPKLLLRLAALLAMLTVGISANAQIWMGTQLGNPGIQGSVVTNGDGTLTIVAGGDDIWNGSDNGYYYFTWTTGDFDAKVRVVSLDTVNSTWAKTEMMVRWSDPATGVRGSDAFIASMCAAAQSPANQHQYRAVRSAGANNNISGAVNVALSFPNNWLRVTRTNSVVTMYAGPDNATWTALATIDTALTDYGFGGWPDLVSVGVAVTAHNNATNTTTVIDQPIISSAGTSWAPPTAAGKALDVANANAHVGGELSFSFRATNNAVPVGFPMLYQWYKGGVTVPGVTGTGYTWLAAAADNGTQVQCVGTVQGYPSVTVTSSIGTAAVSSSTVLITNALKMEIFAGSTRHDAEIGNTGSGDTGNYSEAGKLRWLSALDDIGGWGDNTSRRITGYFIPWVTGNYTFYTASDDDTDVFLSTDSDPANKKLICQEMGWSGRYNWTTNSDATTNNWNQFASAQKCSDTWTNGAGLTPWSAGIPLTAGTLYYIEATEHNGGGGDNVGVTAKLFDAPAPTNGTPSALVSASNNIVVITWPQPTTLSFAPTAGIQPTNTTATEYGPVVFYARASTDSEFQPNYQWQTYGTNIAGATRTQYNITSIAMLQNGMPVRCIATVPGMNSVTSLVATLTVAPGLFEPGFALEERWNNINDIGRGAAGTIGRAPDYKAAIPGFEASINTETGDNYTRKISGFIIFPTTTNVDFYTCSDDNSALYISTSADPTAKSEIARDTAWDNPWEWTISAGNANLAYKGSPTWTNGGSSTPPYAAGITLQANTKYYLEVDHGEGGGGDHVEVAVLPHGAIPINSVDYAPAGSLIGITAPKANWVKFTLQPTNPPPLGAGSTSTANFYAFGTTDSTIPVGDIRANGPNNTEVANQFVFFQWRRNGVPIPGATASHYQLVGVRYPDDNGAVIDCTMRALGYGIAPNTRFFSNSLPATLTVTNVPSIPTITGGGYYLSAYPQSPTISLTFSTALDPAQLTNLANYTINGVNPVSIWVSPDDRRVVLTFNYPEPYPGTITLSGMKTWSGQALVANTFNVSLTTPTGFNFSDIGTIREVDGVKDPVFPGRLWVEGTNAWTIASEGSDIWNNADGFGFLWEAITGNFDVVVRQTAYTATDANAKAGLMAREPYAPGAADEYYTGSGGASRDWYAVNDPAAVPCVDGTTGANTTECNWRYAQYSNTVGWANAPGSTGFGQIPPQYPNAWLRLKRHGTPIAGGIGGQILSAYAGSDGNIWYKVGELDVSTNNAGTSWQVIQGTVTNTVFFTPQPLPDTLLVGVAVTAHHNDNPVTGLLDPLYYNFSSFDHFNDRYVGGTTPTAPTLNISALQTVVTPTATNRFNVLTWSPAIGKLQWSTDGMVTWSDRAYSSPYTNNWNSSVPVQRFFRVVVPNNP